MSYLEQQPTFNKSATVINKNNDEDDFLNSLIDEPLPNEIKFRPSGEAIHKNITREEFLEKYASKEALEESNQINLQEELTKKQRLQENLDMLQEYILTNKIIQKVQIYDTTWYMHVLSVQENREVMQRVNSYNEESQQLAQAFFVITLALERIDDYFFTSFEDTRKFVEQLSLPILYKAVQEYNTLFKRQEELMIDPQQIHSLVSDNFLRIKYQVMRNSGLVPSDTRAQKMNDAQWLWYYYNMDEDLEQKADIRQSELDYLGIFINPKMAQEMIKTNENNRKRRKLEKEKALRKYKAKATSATKKKKINKTVSGELTKFKNDDQLNKFTDVINDASISQQINQSNNSSFEKNNKEDSIDKNDIMDGTTIEDLDPDESILDQVYGSSTYHSSEATVNTEFEKELRAALGDTSNKPIDELFTTLDDDTNAGNQYESQEDFLERVRAFAQYAGTNYGYVKPQKPILRPQQNNASINNVNNQQKNYQPTSELVQQGKSILQASEKITRGNKSQASTILSQQSAKVVDNIKQRVEQNKTIPKWKQDSDREFMQKIGVFSLDEMDKLSKRVDKKEEISKLTDDMDFFSIDDE